MSVLIVKRSKADTFVLLLRPDEVSSRITHPVILKVAQAGVARQAARAKVSGKNRDMYASMSHGPWPPAWAIR
jgi:hypothetical protein